MTIRGIIWCLGSEGQCIDESEVKRRDEQTEQPSVAGSLRDAAMGSPAKLSLSIDQERRLRQC